MCLERKTVRAVPSKGDGMLEFRCGESLMMHLFLRAHLVACFPDPHLEVAGSAEGDVVVLWDSDKGDVRVRGIIIGRHHHRPALGVVRSF